jgi:hypothetical protein
VLAEWLGLPPDADIRHRLCRGREDAGPRSDRLLYQRPGRGTARRDQVAVHDDPELEEWRSSRRGAAPAAHAPHGSEGQTGAAEGTPSLADSPRPSPRGLRRGGRCHTLQVACSGRTPPTDSNRPRLP